MNIWLAVGGIVALVLVAAVVVGTRRPRHAEDELGLPNRQPVRPQTPGSAKQASVKDLMRKIQAQRATGTLQVTAGGRTASLYFLFGHLFHAVSDTVTGEAALRDCLDWRDVQYAFDTKSPLPTEETIERPIDEIVA